METGGGVSYPYVLPLFYNMKPDITQLIDDAYASEQPQKARSYIGASGIGNDCLVAIAYAHRGYPETSPDPKLKRIFRDGHKIEYHVVYDLKKAGISVMENDPMTGKQWSYTAYNGLAIGHADGIVEIDGVAHGLEIKSMNDAMFKSCQKKGVRYSHPKYYDQMQMMMGMAGLECFLFVSYCKNNSLYLHEYVDFDEFRYEFLMSKIERVLKDDIKKIATDESDWRCRGCFKRNACWHGELPTDKIKTTCGNAQANFQGEWVCSQGCTTHCEAWIPYIPKEK